MNTEASFISRNPVFQYALLGVITAGMLAMFLFTPAGELMPCHRIIVPLFGGYLALILGINLALLRQIEAYPDKLVVKTRSGQQDVDYRDLQWIFDMPSRGMGMGCLKYFDSNLQKNQIILFIPPASNGYQDSAMTVFIRNQAIQHNSAYSLDDEPSKWMIYGVFFLISILLIAVIWARCPEFHAAL